MVGDKGRQALEKTGGGRNYCRNRDSRRLALMSRRLALMIVVVVMMVYLSYQIPSKENKGWSMAKALV